MVLNLEQVRLVVVTILDGFYWVPLASTRLYSLFFVAQITGHGRWMLSWFSGTKLN